MNSLLHAWSRHNLEEWKKEKEDISQMKKKETRKEKIKRKFQEKAEKRKKK